MKFCADAKQPAEAGCFAIMATHTTKERESENVSGVRDHCARQDLYWTQCVVLRIFSDK